MWRLAQTLFALWIIHAVRGLRRQGVRIMAEQDTAADQAADDLETLRTSMDTETNRLADLFKTMHEGLPASGGLDAKQTASLKSFLRDHEARLRAIGADAENPVPAPGPVDVPAPAPATPGDAGAETAPNPAPDANAPQDASGTAGGPSPADGTADAASRAAARGKK